MNYLEQTFKWSRFFFLAGAISVSLASCDTEDDPETTTPQTASTTPVFADGNGMLAAVKSITFQTVPQVGEIEIPLGVAVGAFFDGNNAQSFVGAGTVTCETLELSQNPNNSYTFTPGVTNQSGIDFNGDPNWSVSGNGDVPQFDYETNIGFPNVGMVTSGETVTAADGYTLTVNGVSGADSVLFTVGGVVATEAGNATSHTFTAADLENVGSGQSIVQVAAYIIEDQTFSGKKIWFVNERVVSQTVTLQ